jgi:hypothetical protein
MSDYVKRWETLKKAFETTTGSKRPQETTKKILLGTVQKASGITPVLKEIDSALAKKHRVPLEQALNKLMSVRGVYCTFLMKEQKQFVNNPNDPDMVIWTAYKDLIFGVQKIEEDAAKEAKQLQEKKEPNKTAITWLGLEADVKSTVAAAKKLFTPFAAQEKKNNLLKKAEAAMKAAETYTKTAARSEVVPARKALELFKVEAKKCADECAKVLSTEKDPNYKKAVQSFHDAMKALSVLSRVDAQIKNLLAAEKAG